jgi:predicted nucleic acid-binding protein
MILLDANLLLFAYDTSSPFHKQAKTWLEGLFSSGEPVGLCWYTIQAFMRISTNPRAFQYPLSITEALDIVAEWLEPVTGLLTLQIMILRM